MDPIEGAGPVPSYVRQGTIGERPSCLGWSCSPNTMGVVSEL